MTKITAIDIFMMVNSFLSIILAFQLKYRQCVCACVRACNIHTSGTSYAVDIRHTAILVHWLTILSETVTTIFCVQDFRLWQGLRSDQFRYSLPVLKIYSTHNVYCRFSIPVVNIGTQPSNDYIRQKKQLSKGDKAYHSTQKNLSNKI